VVIAVAAIGIVGAGWTSPAAAQTAACTGGGKISKQIAKPMAAAQDAMKAKRWNDVLARVKDAEAVPGNKSAFDLYYMAEFRGYAYHNLREDSDAAREIETTLNSPCVPEGKKLEKYKSLLGIYSSLRNYSKVIDYGNRALKLARDPDITVYVAQAYFQSGNNKEAQRMMTDLLNNLEQNNQRPKEQQLLLVLAACQKGNDNGCMTRVFEKLVSYYPKPEYWENLMVAIKTGDTDDIQRLNIMRLAVHVNVLRKPEDYKEMAQLALEEKLGCEAQTVLEQGFGKKAFVEKRDVDVNTRLLNAAKTQATAEKSALTQSEATARAAATGDADVKVGAQYLACGDAAKAIESLQRGITKGSLAKGDTKEAERNDEASMLLGIAYLKNNNKAEAAKAFKSVKRDPMMVRIAKLWLLNT